MFAWMQFRHFVPLTIDRIETHFLFNRPPREVNFLVSLDLLVVVKKYVTRTNRICRMMILKWIFDFWSLIADGLYNIYSHVSNEKYFLRYIDWSNDFFLLYLPSLKYWLAQELGPKSMKCLVYLYEHIVRSCRKGSVGVCVKDEINYKWMKINVYVCIL